MNITQANMFHTNKLDLKDNLKMFYHRNVFFLCEEEMTTFPKAVRWKRRPKDNLYGKQTHACTEESKSMKLALLREKVSMAASSS